MKTDKDIEKQIKDFQNTNPDKIDLYDIEIIICPYCGFKNESDFENNCENEFPVIICFVFVSNKYSE